MALEASVERDTRPAKSRGSSPTPALGFAVTAAPRTPPPRDPSPAAARLVAPDRILRWSSLTECPRNARLETGVDLSFFLSSSGPHPCEPSPAPRPHTGRIGRRPRALIDLGRGRAAPAGPGRRRRRQLGRAVSAPHAPKCMSCPATVAVCAHDWPFRHPARNVRDPRSTPSDENAHKARHEWLACASAPQPAAEHLLRALSGRVSLLQAALHERRDGRRRAGWRARRDGQ
jgi:hypothetical protein